MVSGQTEPKLLLLRTNLSIFLMQPVITNLCKVNKSTQELIQSDSHQAPTPKGKDRRLHLSNLKMNGWQAELAT